MTEEPGQQVEEACPLESPLHPLHPDNPACAVYSAHLAVAWRLARLECAKTCERCAGE